MSISKINSNFDIFNKEKTENNKSIFKNNSDIFKINETFEKNIENIEEDFEEFHNNLWENTSRKADNKSKKGQDLADYAARNNTKGDGKHCLRGVSNALKAKYGKGLAFNSAYQATKALDSKEWQKDFKKVKCSTDELQDLPAGTIIVYGQYEGQKHGHIAILDGKGNEYSDVKRKHNPEYYINKGASVNVYVPRD